MKTRLFLFTLSAFLSVGLLAAQPGQYSNDEGGWDPGFSAQEGGEENIDAADLEQNEAESSRSGKRDRHRGPHNESFLEDSVDKAKSDEPIKLDQPFLTTEDQIQLQGLYYKGNADESTTPVVLVHGKDGKKELWEGIAKKLAEDGMAVLIPDLRGFGESTNGVIEDFSAGGDRSFVRPSEYRAENFSDEDYEAMRSYDGDLWFWFLLELHNQKKINIRKLVFVTDGFGASVAGSWILHDWQANAKKGRFTRGLAMVSPEEDPVFGKLGSSRAKPGNVNYEIFVGSLDEEKFEAAQKISLKLGKDKADVPESERKVKVESFKTEKQGISLIEVSSFEIPQKILRFINEECRLPEKQQKWQAVKTF